MKKDNTTLILGLAGLGLAYFGLLKPILNALRITSTAETKEQEQNIKTAETAPANVNPWSPNYYKIKGGTVFTLATAKAKAKIIYNALGNFSDDEEAIYGVLKSAKYKTQISFLCDVFYQMYKIDMFEFLKRGKNNWNYAAGLNSSELNQCIEIVKNLK